MQRIPICCFFLVSTQLFLVTTAVRNFSLSSHYDVNDFTHTSTFDELLAKYKPLNLGIGAPDFNPPENLTKALVQAAKSNDTMLTQYGPNKGHPRLIKAVANFFSQRLNRTLKEENVLITIGATEALFSTFQAFSEPKDEWIVFVPCYPMFIPMIKATGALPKFVPLKLMKSDENVTSADFTFDRDELRNAFNAKTKGILVNTPHNPLGKLFTMDELKFIAELANEWDVIVVFDEVYQFINYDDHQHIRLATLPGMFDRTINIGSAGKMFSATGYRVGWLYGPKKLIDNVVLVQNTVVLTNPLMLHEAIAVFLEEETFNYGKATSYISTFRRDIEAKRNYVYELLKNVGMRPILPHGGYFIVVDWTTMIDSSQFPMELDESMDFRFVRWFIENVDVYGWPLSIAYGNEFAKLGEDFIRITINKDNKTLRELEKRLRKWNESKIDEELL